MQRKIMTTMMMVKIQTSREKASRQVATRNIPRAPQFFIFVHLKRKNGEHVWMDQKGVSFSKRVVFGQTKFLTFFKALTLRNKLDVNKNFFVDLQKTCLAHK